MSVMEEEKTGDIYAYASSDDCNDSNQHQLYNENGLTEQQKRQHINTAKEIEKTTLNLIARLPGEVRASTLNITSIYRTHFVLLNCTFVSLNVRARS